MASLPQAVAGRAYDRNGIDSLGIRFLTDTGFMAVEQEPSADSLIWHLEWPESLRGEGTFNLECLAEDGVGHQSVQSYSVVVDTTAPAAPILSPLPTQVNQPGLSVSGTANPGDSILVYLNEAVSARVVCSPVSTFSADVTLSLGWNLIYAEGKDRAGNRSPRSAELPIQYAEVTGVSVPERLQEDSMMEINLSTSASKITLKIFSMAGKYKINLQRLQSVKSAKISCQTLVARIPQIFAPRFHYRIRGNMFDYGITSEQNLGL